MPLHYAILAAVLISAAATAQPAAGKIQTVLGPIDPADLGRALTHEHVMVDFVGADQVSPDRYDADEVFLTMLPYLTDLKAAGIDALFECSPDYLGRDPLLLKRLSEASGIHLITNTGWYKDPFLPPFAHEASAEDIAARWIKEATDGIGDTGIKPGFIKIAVNPGDLVPVQQKIVKAAALTSMATGLVIACHTGHGQAALQELDILDEVGCPADRLIIVHCDAEPDQDLHWRIAERGAWLSYDGIREGNAEQRLPLLLEALKRYPDQLLISQDAGWYNVGEPNGGNIVAWDWMPLKFIPILQAAGGTDAQITTLLTTNPIHAFTIRPPS